MGKEGRKIGKFWNELTQIQFPHPQGDISFFDDSVDAPETTSLFRSAYMRQNWLIFFLTRSTLEGLNNLVTYRLSKDQMIRPVLGLKDGLYLYIFIATYINLNKCVRNEPRR